MTIPNLAVNLSGVFEYGQAYVGELCFTLQCQVSADCSHASFHTIPTQHSAEQLISNV
jgi:hypothetical protein